MDCKMYIASSYILTQTCQTFKLADTLREDSVIITITFDLLDYWVNHKLVSQTGP